MDASFISISSVRPKTVISDIRRNNEVYKTICF